MMIVDSHCHVATNWWEPVESLLFQMDRFGVERAVLVGDYAEPNNEYQSRCVRRFAGRFASVVVVDPSRQMRWRCWSGSPGREPPDALAAGSRSRQCVRRVA